jgi:hypothetical protein
MTDLYVAVFILLLLLRNSRSSVEAILAKTNRCYESARQSNRDRSEDNQLNQRSIVYLRDAFNGSLRVQITEKLKKFSSNVITKL